MVLLQGMARLLYVISRPLPPNAMIITETSLYTFSFEDMASLHMSFYNPKSPLNAIWDTETEFNFRQYRFTCVHNLNQISSKQYGKKRRQQKVLL